MKALRGISLCSVAIYRGMHFVYLSLFFGMITLCPLCALDRQHSKIESIMNEFREVAGLNDVRSLILEGTYLEDGRQFEMRIVTRLPNLISKQLRDEGSVTKTSFDGEVSTIRMEQSEGQPVEQELEESMYLAALLVEASWLALAKNDSEVPVPKLALLKEEVINRHVCRVIRSQFEGQLPVVHYIDFENSVLVARSVEFMQDGQPAKMFVHFSDYKQGMPQRYRLEVNKQVRGEATIRAIRKNEGVMPWMF